MKNYLIIFYVFCIFSWETIVKAAASDTLLADLKRGQPQEVIELIDRLVGCNHWSNEEPYDADRKKEIALAMADLRCNKVIADKSATLKRYAKIEKTVRALKQAEQMNY